VARWISILAHPLVTAGVTVLAGGVEVDGPARAGRSLLLVAGLTLAPVAWLMVRQVRRGRWRDVDASRAHERPALFAVGLAGLGGLLVYLRLTDPASYLVGGVAAVGGMLLVAAAVTRRLKISLHLAFAAFASTTLLWLRSPAGWVLLAVLPALAWSRLALGRHRPLEVAAGVALGGLAAGLARWL
jgi:hypothetical protein